MEGSSIRNDLKIPLTMLSLHYLDKIKYRGSYKGKRFIFEKITEIVSDTEKKVVLRVHVWKDYLKFELTKKEDIITKDFTYDNDGIDKGLDFVEETKI